MHIITKTCVLLLWMHLLTFVQSQGCTRQEFLDSRHYDSNFDITGLDASYPRGRQVRVGCNIGFTGFFKLMCLDDGWKTVGSKCQPKSCGHPGDAQFADFKLEDAEDFVFGSKVVYTCHKGYQMVSRTNFRRCMSEGWDGVVPVCEAQQCPVIHVDSNVQVIGDPEDANYGNVVRFRCKSSSQVLEGSPEMYCDDNGQWSGTEPKCIDITCEIPFIENGLVPGGVQEYQENQVLNYQCNSEYKRAEERPSKCMKSGTKADWSPTPRCIRIQCEVKLPPLEGTRYESTSKNLFLPGDTLKVFCGEEHWIANSQTRKVETTCQNDGTWSIRPVCQEVICSIQRPPHVSTWRVYTHSPKKLGVSVYYTCFGGYRITSRNSYATCTRDGWGPKPLCRGTQCTKLNIENADITNPRDLYSNGERVQYTCRNGNRNTFIITCEEGDWTGLKSCPDNAECQKPSHFPNGFVVGPYIDKLYYTCHHGYKPFTKGWWGEARCTGGVWTGLNHCIDKSLCGETPVIPNGKASPADPRGAYSSEITCNEGYYPQVDRLTCDNGKWLPAGSGLSLKTICRPHTDNCSPPPKIENAVVLSSYQKEYLSDSEVTYQCRDKFKMAGEDKIRCNAGKWEKKNITCIPYCDKLNNEKQSMNFTSEKDKYMNGEVIKYQCNIPDPVAEGSATCKDGEWTKTVECKAKPCPPPPVTENGGYKPTKKEDFVFGEAIQYVCNEGYRMEGNDTLKCLQHGWAGKAPTCKLITCGGVGVLHPDLIVTKKLTASEIDEVGQKLEFDCSSELQLNGSKVIQCLPTGQWSAPTPTCSEKCEISRLPDNVVVTPRLSGRHLIKGQKLTFSCSRHGQIIQGNATVECLASGQWSHSFPACIVPDGCGRPPALADGEIKTTVKREYRHNDKVEYVCQSHYLMEGEPFKTCKYGEWSGSMRCLKPCTVDKDVMRRHNIRFRHSYEEKLYAPHNDFITFSCIYGTSPVDTVEMRQKCNDGEMNFPACA